jgi:hypothetical protein
MGLLTDLGHALGALRSERTPPPRPATPADAAPLTAAAVASFIEASSGRGAVDPLTTDPRALASFALLPRPSTRGASLHYGDLLAVVRRRRPVRLARLQRDFRWLQREAVRHGYSAEEARWLL